MREETSYNQKICAEFDDSYHIKDTMERVMNSSWKSAKKIVRNVVQVTQMEHAVFVTFGLILRQRPGKRGTKIVIMGKMLSLVTICTRNRCRFSTCFPMAIC